MGAGADTLATTATPIVTDALDLAFRLLPYGTPWTILIGGALWYFREQVKTFLTARASGREQIMSDLASLKETIEAHVKEEAETAGELTEQGKRIHSLEISQVEVTSLVKGIHEAVNQSNLDIRELRSAIMQVLGKL